MKKLIFLLAIFVCAITPCSCTVNWFGETYDAPWYVIAIPIAIIAVVGYFILMNTVFVCPDCNTEFKPKWYQLSVCVHMGRKRLAKCPKCGRFGYCARAKDVK